MLLVLRNELEKMFLQKKTWASLVLLNLVSFAVLLAAIFIPILMLKPETVTMLQGLEATENTISNARSFVAGAVILWVNSFSMLATFTLALQSSSVFAAEFGDDSIQMLFLAPVSRFSVWAGKVFAVVLLYLSAWLLGLSLMVLAYLRFQYLSPSFEGVLWDLPLGRLLCTYALLDLTTLAFFLWISTMSSSVMGATLSSLGAYLGLILFGFAVSSLRMLPIFTGVAVQDPRIFQWWRTYGFPGAVQTADAKALKSFLFDAQGGYPIAQGVLATSLAWMVIFLVLGLLCFSRREAKPER